MKADEFARLSCLISNRVARLEGEVTMLSSTCSLASKKHTVDPSAERIKCLEAELAETKKVRFVYMLIVLVRVFFLLNEAPIFVHEAINMWLAIF